MYIDVFTSSLCMYKENFLAVPSTGDSHNLVRFIKLSRLLNLKELLVGNFIIFYAAVSTFCKYVYSLPESFSTKILKTVLGLVFIISPGEIRMYLQQGSHLWSYQILILHTTFALENNDLSVGYFLNASQTS
jgi:hypothetical protein